MTARGTVKAASRRPKSVGVIFSGADLQRALRLRRAPDFFELRLDGLVFDLDELGDALPRLRAPFIITARSPSEGGANHLALVRRRELLLQFLPKAALVDIELRAALALSPVCAAARAGKIPLILSRHDFKTTPSVAALLEFARQAHLLGAAIFKIAVRTDSSAQLDRLLEFVESKAAPLPISAMGMGRRGCESRVRLARAGSVLNYAHLGRATVAGQWSLVQLRALLKRRR